MYEGKRFSASLCAVAAVVVGLLAVAGCGSSSKPSTGAAATTATTAATPTTATTPEAPTTASSSTSAPPSSSAGGSATISGPGVSATQIKIGQIATVSGPVPGLFQNAADSLDAYAAYINSQGGIDGHKLVIVHKDDSYDCVSYTNALKSLSTQVFAVVGTFSVEDGCGASVLKANPSLSDIEADIINPELFTSPNAFAAVSQPPGYLTTGYNWVKGKYPASITHTAQLYETAAALDANAQKKAAESVGYKYLYRRGLGTAETNFTSDILRMKSEGVKIVDLTGCPLNVATSFEQEAAQQNFHPDALLSATAYDSTFFSLIGNSTAAANLIAPLYFPLYLGQDRATNPELATYLTWLQKTHPGKSANLFGTTAWAAGVLFSQSIARSGARVTQTSVLHNLTNSGSFTANGLLPATNPGTRQGPSCQVIVGVHNGQFVRLAPPTSGFECNGTWLNIPLSQLGS